MQIFIKALLDKLISLNVEPNETIKLVKQKIQGAGFGSDIPFYKLILIFGGKKLEDNKTLANYDIQEGSILNLIFDQFYLFIVYNKGEKLKIDCGLSFCTCCYYTLWLKEEIKKRLLPKGNQGDIKRIYENEDDSINMCSKEVNMEVSSPIFMIGIKDKLPESEEVVKKHIAIEIILNMLIGKSSDLYKELYSSGDLLAEPDLDYEFSKQYAHVLVGGQSKNPELVYEKFKNEVSKFKEEGLNEEHFERIKRKIYGDYVTEYNSVADIARMFLADSFKGINSFDYVEKFNVVTKEFAEQILKEVFDEEKMAISIIRPQ